MFYLNNAKQIEIIIIQTIPCKAVYIVINLFNRRFSALSKINPGYRNILSATI